MHPAATVSRMENHRPRIRMGARSENQGNQHTLMAAEQQEETPSRKISVHSGSQEGSEGTTSGIMRAEDPEAMLDEMIGAVRKAWDDLNK